MAENGCHGVHVGLVDRLGRRGGEDAYAFSARTRASGVSAWAGTTNLGRGVRV